MTIKTFRGLLADGAQEEIHLRTKTGKIGYRIVKFQVIPIDGNTAYEGIVQVFKIEQTTPVPDVINLANNNLLAAAVIQQTTGGTTIANSTTPVIIFENEIFNQNIYISHDEKSAGAGSAVNYYIELEQIKLNDNESTMATLQSIRSRYESYKPAGPS